MSRRRAALFATIAAAAAAAGLGIERTMLAAPRYRGPASDHFDGERFHNLDPAARGEGSFLKWQMERPESDWPDWIDTPYGAKPPARVADGRLRVTFINHATLLIQIDGVNILTDPIWSERTSPVSFAGPRRHRNPGIRFEDLPPIDVVLVSHNHYDHCDIATLQRLAAPRVITPLGNKALLEKHGIANVEERDWWEAVDVAALRITVVPSQHFCARGLSDRDRNLWGGFVIQAPSGTIYFAGDTGWGSHFAKIGTIFGPIRLALLPIGAYLPRWFMKPVHIDPAEAVEAHKALGASTSVAMHFGTFRLSDERFAQPVEDLQQALAANGDPRFWVLGQGEGRDVP